ncbi:hypothetical protein, partial [Gluconobacter sp. Gdi]|uniref:hypothetical protein n=1 Tax=Gluconobacter sp. Gdi TaxID=2691888 RepID=UPI001920E08F
RVLGTTVPEAAKKMADAYADPAQAAKTFAQQGLLGVHQGLVQQVSDLQSSGNRLEAWQLLMVQVERATAGAAHDGLTPLQTALHGLDQAFNGPVDGAKSLSRWLGDGIDEGAAKTIRLLTGVVDLLNKIRTAPLNGDDMGGITQKTNTLGTPASVSSTIDTVGASLGAPSDVISLA